MNHMLEKQVETQINHYKELEKVNGDMRSFKHDYVNHLNSILALIEAEYYSEAQQYVEKLTESNRHRKNTFNTGNCLADAILTDKSEACRDFAYIEFEGCISNEIENSDMCIILSNALDNAIEACRKCSGRSKISIAAQTRQGYWTMAIKNPTVASESFDGIPKTTKEDAQNHGFGLLSIERTVKGYDGTMEVGIKDGFFEFSIIMKTPQTK